jgi:hypothetical protein
MKNNSKPNRDFLTLDSELDEVFAIDRMALCESDEEDPPFPELETIDKNLITVEGYVNSYRRLVGRRIAARESLINKSKEQAVEDEIQHLRQTIAPLVGRDLEMISSEDRFYEIVPARDQRKVWTSIFADFPALIPWRKIFFYRPLAIYFIVLFFVIPTIAGITNALFPEILQTIFYRVFFIVALLGFGTLFLTILIQQIFYYRHHWAYQALTLREIAQKIVDAKEKYIDYPIRSVDEVEPLLLKTLSECFDIPLDSLKPKTRLDTNLGFEF